MLTRRGQTLLGLLLAFGALNAFGGGIYGLRGAPGVPREWLAGSPFDSYAVPSLVLFGVVGLSLLVASAAVFSGHDAAPTLAAVAGVILLGWLVVQVAIIGPVSWLQPATALIGLVVLWLAWRGKRRGAP
jgi:hypothetical protein